MELPPDAPRPPVLPFIVGDVVLLAVAGYLAYSAGPTPSTGAIVGIVVCTGIGVALGIAPFLLAYARQREEALDHRQRALEAMVRSTAEATDQASIAASGLHEIAETTRRNLATLENLPAPVAQAKAASANGQAREPSAPVDLAPLQAAIAALQSAQAEELAALADAVKETRGELALVESRLADTLAKIPPPAAPADSESKPKAKRAKKPAEPEASLFEETVPESAEPADTDDSPDDSAEPEPESAESPEPAPSPPPAPKPRKRATRKAKEPPPAEPAPIPAKTPPATADEDAAEEPEPIAETPAPTDDEPPEEESLSADGFTRLTVTAYIGIGNRLFIRGDGPGLSPEEGTPLQFVSIGKWRWETADATAPVKFTLWKNDQEPCQALGEITLKPGGQREVSASF